MSLIWIGRSTLAFATIVLPALYLDAVPPVPEQTTAHASLAGQLLVASPSMADPRFDHAVILVVRHDRNSALGIEINQPVAERPLADVLALLGEKDSSVAGKVRIFAGGPVQPDVGFVLHSADYHRAGTVDIDKRVAMTASREILRDIGNGKGPKKSIVAFGYAGWGPGQLDNELERRVWFVAPADETLIFDASRDKVWDIAFSHRTQNL